MKFKLLLITLLISFSAFGQNRTDDIIVNGVKIGRFITLDQTRELCKYAVKPWKINSYTGLPQWQGSKIKKIELSNGNFILNDQKVRFRSVQYIELYSDYTNAEDINMKTIEFISGVLLIGILYPGLVGIGALGVSPVLIAGGFGSLFLGVYTMLAHNIRIRKHIGFKELYSKTK